MNRRIIAAVVIAVAAIITVFSARDQLPAQSKEQIQAAGDISAIATGARAYTDAFNKGDAKAIAAMWSEKGECREASGRTFVGREDIEKAFAAYFKANPGMKIEVLIKSVRFPAKDLAIEQGLIRQSRGAKDLPSTIAYEAIHVREGDQWKIALSSEGGPGQDRLEDLDWLLGDWTTKVKDGTVKLSFVRDPKKQVITGTFTRTPGGKISTIELSKDPKTGETRAVVVGEMHGSIRIALDPETGHIRSWGFEDDGAHSQALWHCDGKSWILDQRGVLADGTTTSERIVLQRVSADVITWRAIDRLLGDMPLPDTIPMRLTRTTNPK